MKIILFLIFLPILLANVIPKSENADESETKILFPTETANRQFNLKGFLLKNLKKIKIGSNKRKLTKNIQKFTNKLRMKSQGGKRIMSGKLKLNEQINALIDKKYEELRSAADRRTIYENCIKSEICQRRNELDLVQKAIKNLEKERKELKNEQELNNFYEKLNDINVQTLISDFEEKKKENKGIEIGEKIEDDIKENDK